MHVEGIPDLITWHDIQQVAGQVVQAVRKHTGAETKLGEIRVRPAGIVFTGKDWKAVYGSGT